MSKFFKRYLWCALIIVLLFISYYVYYKRHLSHRPHSDEFISVAYLDEDDAVVPKFSDLSRSGRLLNLTDFQYNIQPKLCVEKNQNLLAILLVTSYVGHDDVRSSHRAAISASTLTALNILRVFLLGEIPLHEKFITQKAIEHESLQFNDIVQGNFIEAYRNLSYKHVMGLRWSVTHDCLRPKFIIKMDDDIVVDFFYLTQHLNDKFSSSTAKHLLSGYVFRNVAPIKIKQNKWYVSDSEFDGSVYPDYLSGWMYVASSLTVNKLVSAAQDRETKIFWIDDTWITGILRDQQGIPIDESLNSLFSANSEFLDCCLNDVQQHGYSCPFIAGPNGGDHKLIEKFVQAIQRHCFNRTIDFTQNYCRQRPSNKASLKTTCVGQDKHLLRENHGAAIVNAMKL